jgi:hypothetical protein
VDRTLFAEVKSAIDGSGLATKIDRRYFGLLVQMPLRAKVWFAG